MEAADNNSHAAWVARVEALDELARSWKDAGLSVFQKGAGESDALRVAANAELVASGRREVSGKTRDFSKLQPEEKLKELGPLVKAYQGYVDDVTRALRHAESAHKTVHAFIRQLTDPYPTLEKFLRSKSALLSTVKAAESSSDLRAQLREREAELGELRNQEVTIRHLREEIAVLELVASSATQEVASEASAETQQLLRQWQEREAAVQHELQLISQECRKFQLKAGDLTDQLGSTQEALSDARLQADRIADEAANETMELRVALGTAQHEAAGLRETVASLRQQLASSHAKTPARDQELAGGTGNDVTPEGQMMIHGGRDRSQPPAAGTHTTGDDASVIQSADSAALHARLTAVSAELKSATNSRDVALVEVAQLKEANETLQRQAKGADRRREEAAEDAKRVAEQHDAELRGVRLELATVRGQLNEAQQRERKLRATVVDLQADLSAAEKQVAAARNGGRATPTTGDAVEFDLARVLPAASSSGGAGDGNNNNGRGTPTTPSGPPSTDTGGESIAALLQQRESLRKRIRSLEEVGLSEVRAMRHDLEAARRENAELKAALDGGRSDPLADEAPVRHPPSRFGLAQQAAVDRAASIVSHLVLSSRQSRRAFAAYQLVLHVILFLFLAYEIL